ncbi:MAG: DUF4342 domain-containing protein [Ruminiclostridium sp.]|nr:DUF4342 domain-containing protein [Ruminiclostridium sp.]
MVTLEQVDQLRKRTNCSYEEAKALLERHNGDVLEAIVEFEKGKQNKSFSNYNGCCDNQEWKKRGGEFWQKFKELIQKGFENKVIIEDKNGVILNMSVNILLLLIIFIPYITLPALLLVLILGYKLSVKKVEGKEYNISSMVREAADRFSGRCQQQPQASQPAQAPNVPAEMPKDDYNEMTIE